MCGIVIGRCGGGKKQRQTECHQERETEWVSKSLIGNINGLVGKLIKSRKCSTCD